MAIRSGPLAASLVAILGAVPLTAMTGERPKPGGILTYGRSAELRCPPGGTFATVHSAAPFYSVLLRVDPNNPSSTTDFVRDLCTAIPQPTDGGRTYTFNIREDVKFHDGTPLTAADVAASWEEIIHPPEGLLSPRESHYMMVDTVEAPDPTTVVFHLKFALPAELCRQLRTVRGPTGDRALRQDAARNRPYQAANADARLREIRARYPDARDLSALVIPDRGLPVICQGLEDQPQPLPQPGLSDDLVR